MLLLLPLWLVMLQCAAQPPFVSKVWTADKGDGTYRNPVLHADYSDPDVIRVQDTYYLVASSFEATPGLPILQSEDLVNWRILTYALPRQEPAAVFSKPQHGNGVWAPSIRYHKDSFYIYYPDPDYGIYLIKARQAAGPWSEPVLVQAGKGLIDPCPFWDDDGQAYLVHAYAGSRAGIKSLLVLKKLNAAGNRVMEEGQVVYDGHLQDPTIEGPKLYKRNGYYYLFAPAGGVGTGWQLALRSKNIYGPYERKVVMDQGASAVNGPHQGAWVNTVTGEDWFLHFQDKEAYGRVVHLQPMQWVNDWPLIGADKDGDGKGEPVPTFRKPNVRKSYPVQTPPDTDEFNNHRLGLQWQWMANVQPYWYFTNPGAGTLRLYAISNPDTNAVNLWETPNVLLQKFMAPEFTTTAKMTFMPGNKLRGERFGLTVMGMHYAALYVRQGPEGNTLCFATCAGAEHQREKEIKIAALRGQTLYLRVSVRQGGACTFSYSIDGVTYLPAGNAFTAATGRWIGAKVGLFATADSPTNDAGFTDVDYFRVTPVE